MSKHTDTTKDTLNAGRWSIDFLKKQWSNILFVILIGLLLYPPTGRPIKTFVHRFIALSPKELKASKQESLDSFDWNLVNAEGELVDLNALKGQVILVNFWASWCPPCIAEMPSLQSLYADYQNRIAFLFVSNETLVKSTGFMRKKGYDLPVYQPASKVPDQLSSQSIPATFLISPKGKIVVRKMGSANWNSESFRQTLDELLTD